MTLNLVQIPMRVSALSRWAKGRGWAGGDFDEGRALHHLLSECFGKGVLQPFRLMVPPRGQGGNLYGYTTVTVEELRDTMATIALPEMLDVITPAALRGKPMPGFRAGQRLGFDLRCRPVRRTRNPAFRKGAEVDAYLLAIQSDNMAGISRETVYMDWLAERLRGVAELDPDHGRLAGMQRRKIARGQHAPEGPDATLHGTLTVTDGAAFAALLAKGVGRHCAYGYGMMMMRAPQAPVPGC